MPQNKFKKVSDTWFDHYQAGWINNTETDKVVALSIGRTREEENENAKKIVAGLNNEFNFFDNTLAFSFENPKEGKQEMASDFILGGNIELVVKGLIEMCERHPAVATIICETAYNYMVENGKPMGLQELLNYQP